MLRRVWQDLCNSGRNDFRDSPVVPDAIPKPNKEAFLMRRHLFALFAGALLLGAPLAQAADDRDTSADASHAAVSDSGGVILRVPINAQGEENTDAAELAVTSQSGDVPASQLPQVWTDATVMDRSTAIAQDSSTSSDSSTWGWSRWYGYGWRSPYYYSYYTPSYRYYGSYYPYYGSYYGYYPSYYNYYGYRYYYYPRYWY
jgi:hypothetical protein